MMILVVFYMFAIVAMEAFGGLVYSGDPSLAGATYKYGSPFYLDLHLKNPHLNSTEFSDDGYYKMHFNKHVPPA